MLSYVDGSRRTSLAFDNSVTDGTLMKQWEHECNIFISAYNRLTTTNDHLQTRCAVNERRIEWSHKSAQRGIKNLARENAKFRAERDKSRRLEQECEKLKRQLEWKTEMVQRGTELLAHEYDNSRAARDKSRELEQECERLRSEIAIANARVNALQPVPVQVQAIPVPDILKSLEEENESLEEENESLQQENKRLHKRLRKELKANELFSDQAAAATLKANEKAKMFDDLCAALKKEDIDFADFMPHTSNYVTRKRARKNKYDESLARVNVNGRRRGAGV